MIGQIIKGVNEAMMRMKRAMKCNNCQREITFCMRDFFHFSKKCPYCDYDNKLELETSWEIKE